MNASSILFFFTIIVAGAAIAALVLRAAFFRSSQHCATFVWPETVDRNALESIELQSDTFRVSLTLNYSPDNNLSLVQLDSFYRYPNAAGGWQERAGWFNQVCFGVTGVNRRHNQNSMPEDYRTRWLGWSTSLAGNTTPHDLFVIVVPSRSGSEMAPMPLDLDRLCRVRRRTPASPAAPFRAATTQNLTHAHKPSSVFSLAGSHFGLPLALALAAAGLLAAALPWPRRRLLGFAATSTLALGCVKDVLYGL